MKKLLILLLALTICISMAACATDAPTGTGTPEPSIDAARVVEQNCELKLNSDGLANVKLHGRTNLTESNLQCNPSGSGIEFNAYIDGPLTLHFTVSGECYFTLYIDGERQSTRITAGKGLKRLELASFSDGKVHNIKLIKQTESLRALCEIKSISFKGYFEAPPEDKLLIEFIGDSITAGYGNLCQNGAEDGKITTFSDATNAYAWLAAQDLDADCSLVCCSGIGLVKGYEPYPMSTFYPLISYHRDQQAVFTPDRKADIVVINLGTNDESLGVDSSEVAANAAALIHAVRATHGEDTPIIWVHGMMNSGMFSDIRKVLEDELGGEANGIYSVEMQANNGGGHGHPSVAGHALAAKTLAAFIQEKILLQS